MTGVPLSQARAVRLIDRRTRARPTASAKALWRFSPVSRAWRSPTLSSRSAPVRETRTKPIGMDISKGGGCK